MTVRAVAVRPVAALALAAVLAVPAGVVAADDACADTGARIGVVVDFGDQSGAPAGVTATCLDVGDRATGAEALAARARRLGTPPPRYAPSGLLCAIDGYPESGCGERTADGYAYWSYWHSEAGQWVYADDGPAGHRLSGGDVDGWRFQVGAARPTDSPPRASPDPGDTCPPPPPTSTTTEAAPSTAAPAAGSTSSKPSPAPTSGQSSPVPGRADREAGPLTDTDARSDTLDGLSDSIGDGDHASAGPTAVDGPTNARRVDDDEISLGERRAADGRTDGDGLPVAPILAVALAALLGVLAIRRSRREDER